MSDKIDTLRPVAEALARLRDKNKGWNGSAWEQAVVAVAAQRKAFTEQGYVIMKADATDWRAIANELADLARQALEIWESHWATSAAEFAEEWAILARYDAAVAKAGSK